MNTPNIRNCQTEYYRNKKEDYSFKNNSYLSIHRQNKIKKKPLPTLNFNENINAQNSYLIVPVYQTLKAEKYIKNFNYKPSINFINSKKNSQFEEKYFSKDNGTMSVKSQSLINQKLLNEFKNNDFRIKSVENNNKFYTDNINERFNNSSLSNSNIYKNIYSSMYSPRRSPKAYLINQVMDKNSFIILNSHNNSNCKKLYDNNHINKVKSIKYYKNSIENFNIKKNNSRKSINTFNNIMNSIDFLDKKKFSNAKSYKCIKNGKNLKLIKNSSEINKLKNNYFKKKDIISYQYNDKLIKTKENPNIIKNIKHSFKSNIIENLENSNIILFKRNNINLNSNKSSNGSHNNSLFQKALRILIKIIKNRIYNYFLLIKYLLFKEKSSTNYNKFISKMKAYKNLSKLIKQNTKNNTLDNAINNNILLNNKEHDTKLISYNKKKKKGLETKYKELLNENLKLQNKNNILKNEKEEAIKQLSIIKEENKKLNKKLNKNPKINNLINENIKLSNKLKYIYIKYLINSKISHHNEKLKDNLHFFQRKVHFYCMKDEKRKNILKSIIDKKDYEEKNILRKYFYKFYFKSKMRNNIIQKKNIINLMHILYKKEKKFFLKKKYFDKFYYNSININANKTQGKLIINADFNFEKRQNKLKTIINNTMKKINNITIIRSILKQWALRTKIINMNIMIVKEENNKNIIKPIKNLIKSKDIKNILNNNFKKDNLIKGIKKLNNIFMSYESLDKSDEGNKIQKNINNELNDLNQKINNDINKIIFNRKENINNKLYQAKLKYKSNDWIIEEKEEEQSEDNGESISFKNDIE